MVYYFKSQLEADSFFANDQTGARATGEIDMSQVVSVRVNSKHKMKGIELHTPGRIWLLCFETESEFVAWLSAFSRIVNANVLRIQQLTGDDELSKDISNIDLHQMDMKTHDLFNTGVGFGNDMIDNNAQRGQNNDSPNFTYTDDPSSSKLKSAMHAVRSVVKIRRPTLLAQAN